MQQLLQDMKDMEETLLPVCQKVMTWKSSGLFEDFQEVTQPMTTLVSLLLNNKQVLGDCGIVVEEKEILDIMERMIQALESKDEVYLLDSVYQGYLPWLRKIRLQIDKFLKEQEG